MDNRIISVRFSGRLLNWYDTLEGNKSDVLKEFVREGVEKHQINIENYKLEFKSIEKKEKGNDSKKNKAIKKIKKWDFPK